MNTAEGDAKPEGTHKWVGAGYYIETDPDKLVAAILDAIEAKRDALGI